MNTPDTSNTSDILNEIDRLARRERGRLLARLLKHFGPQHIQLAEDVVQEALLSAMSVWPYQGLPENPIAWLSRVARNRVIDRLRHESREQRYEIESDTRTMEDSLYLPIEGDITDPELGTIFLCCHPELNELDQLAITLRVVGGFTAKEIAAVFIMNESALAKRLTRAKQRIKETSTYFLREPSADEIKLRLNPALKVLYLMFSLGYAPALGQQLVRRDVALEALRLAGELAGNSLTSSPQTSALTALLYFQASRLDARENQLGEPVLFREQDRSRWDKEMIHKALIHLRDAATGESVSRYHLEAGIAAIYATAPSWDDIDWTYVLEQYRLLRLTTDSPVVIVNACVALAFSGNPEGALQELLTLCHEPRLKDYGPFHIAKAEIYRLLNRDKESRDAYDDAMLSRVSAPVLQHLERRLATTT